MKGPTAKVGTIVLIVRVHHVACTCTCTCIVCLINITLCPVNSVCFSPCALHQVNLEYLGRVVFNSDGMLYPDSLVGTDSHTTMINGLGIVGWGKGYSWAGNMFAKGLYSLT